MENRFVFTVSELTRHIKVSIEPMYIDIWVEGEISNMRIPSSGHCYFTLKDKGSQIRAVMFRFRGKLLRFEPEDGMKVICRGRINVYEPRGEYQLLVEMMEPLGVGDLQLAFEQLKKKLQEEGFFDEKRKQALPYLPGKIAVITSPTGAAIQDILKILHRRFPNLEVLVVPVKVQGDEAPEEIVEALQTVNEHIPADVIILARGGGSLEDLWAFNTENVARAIYISKIPVISAIGHEVDFTISDFTADVRAPTPSAAAELVVKNKQEIVQHLAHLGTRLRNSFLQYIERKRDKIHYCHSHLRYPVKRVEDFHLRHDELHMRMLQTMQRFLQKRKDDLVTAEKIILSRTPSRTIQTNETKVAYLTKTGINLMRARIDQRTAVLKNSIGRLNSLNPASILMRGFSIVRVEPSLEIVKDSADLKQGDMLNIKFNNGEAICSVRETLPE